MQELHDLGVLGSDLAVEEMAGVAGNVGADMASHGRHGCRQTTKRLCFLHTTIFQQRALVLQLVHLVLWGCVCV